MEAKKLAIGLVVLSTLGFAIQDMVVKLLSEFGSLWQLMFLRAILVVLILITWARLKKRPDSIQPKGWKWPIIRAFLMSCAYSFFYASLPFTALAQAASCFFTAPIFTCFFAALILKEKNWHMENIIHISGFFGGFVYHSARHFQYASYFVSSGVGRSMLRTWCCNNARILRRSSSIIADNYPQCILRINWCIYGDFCSYFAIHN
jgi:uncharacterized membrane protein